MIGVDLEINDCHVIHRLSRDHRRLAPARLDRRRDESLPITAHARDADRLDVFRSRAVHLGDVGTSSSTPCESRVLPITSNESLLSRGDSPPRHRRGD